MGIERRATDSAPARYRPRRPSRSVLYRCVQAHLETWLAQCRDCHDDDGPVPPYVEREFRRYLECGILAHGFARARPKVPPPACGAARCRRNRRLPPLAAPPRSASCA